MEGNIIIEVTRKCNLRCLHCLRGEMENTDIDLVYIDALLNQYDSIYQVTFTGGEPSLNVKALEYFLTQAKAKGVNVGSFFIYTNGVKISEEFVIACLKLYSYCYEKDMCGVQVSNDYYHSEQAKYNTDLLDGLGFFGRKHQKEADTYPLIYQGLAKDNYDCTGRMLEEYEITTQDDFYDASIYLNVNGDIVNGCDWSYEEQDDHIICEVGDLRKFYDSLEKE